MALRLTEAEYRALLLRRSSPQVKVVIPRSRSGAVEEFALQLDLAVIAYKREFKFLADRKFRFDFVMLPLCMKLAVEFDGQVHRIHERFHADREKFNLALAAGWRVVHVGREQTRTGEAVKMVLGALQQPAMRTLQVVALDALKIGA